MKILNKGKIVNYISIIITICLIAYTAVFVLDRTNDKQIFQTVKKHLQ